MSGRQANSTKSVQCDGSYYLVPSPCPGYVLNVSCRSRLHKCQGESVFAANKFDLHVQMNVELNFLMHEMCA